MRHEFITPESFIEATGDFAREAIDEPDASDQDLALDPRVVGAVEEANDTAADYIRKRHALPLIEISAGLRGACVALARHAILVKGSHLKLGDSDDRDLNKAIDYLEKIANGKIALAAPPENQHERIAPGAVVPVGADAPPTGGVTAQPFWGAF